MDNFKFSLKNIAAATLIIVCAALAFWGLGQNEKGGGNKNLSAGFSGYAASVPSAGHILSEPVMPKGFRATPLWRNPFAPPPEIVAPRPNPASISPPLRPPESSSDALSLQKPPNLSKLPVTKSVELPSLAGIVSSNSRRMAIIRHRGASRAYSEGEQVGSYFLVQIMEDKVILKNPAGEHIIWLP